MLKIDTNDVRWDRRITRHACYAPRRCHACGTVYSEYLRFNTKLVTSFDDTTVFANLPCGHTQSRMPITPDTLALLILAAEDAPT